MADDFGKILVALFSSVAVIAILGAMFTYIVSMAGGLGLFFFTPDGVALSGRVLAGIPLDIFLAIPILIPVEASVGEVFIGLWLIYAACFVAAWLDFGGFHQSIRRDFWQPLAFSKINYLRSLPLIGAGLLSTVLIVHSIQESEGIGTGGISFPSPLVALFNLAYSPVREELGFRITPLGAAAAIIVFAAASGSKPSQFAGWSGRLKLIALAFAAPQRARAAVGLPTIRSSGWRHGVSWVEWVLAVAISVFFGAAHLLAGGGWEPGKVTSAALSGFVLALVYFSHGVYAPILLHWFFNYYFMAADLTAQTYPALAFMAPMVNLVTIWFGIVVLMAWAINLVVAYFFKPASAPNQADYTAGEPTTPA